MSLPRKLWSFPWSYAESFLIGFALCVTAIAIQFFTRSFAPLPSFPVNIIVLCLFVIVLILLFIFGRNNSLVQWMMSIPATIGAVSFFGLISLMMGLIPQFPQAPPTDILHNITESWLYFFSLVYILTVLGLVTLKRLVPFKVKNFGFQMNHLGLWIVLAGSSFGAGDMQRLTMETQLGKTEWIAFNRWGEPVEPGIAVELKAFHIDFFEPSLQVYDTLTNKSVKRIKPAYLTQSKTSFTIGDYQVQVKEFYPEAMAMGDGFKSFIGPGSIPAAFVVAEKDGKKYEGWVNPQNRMIRGNTVYLDEGLALILQPSQPKRYVSQVKVYSSSGTIITDSLQVNSPLYIDGWYLYQVSYNQEMGRWSETSTIELNKDPWLPVVYTGIFMLIIGSVFLFFRGSKIKEQTL
ncbi:MAG: hypothetical protein CVU05_05875 [Bacteroidetes bacterium HGW-Bacteroidetes-21]|jgi:hypothetical protein|nr:MAG: hypothetical protein CVU05_05875 [Bacteroidetes bacterium HGW-Bacteroidetes-21]